MVQIIVDTERDSPETIRRAIRFLEEHLGVQISAAPATSQVAPESSDMFSLFSDGLPSSGPVETPKPQSTDDVFYMFNNTAMPSTDMSARYAHETDSFHTSSAPNVHDLLNEASDDDDDDDASERVQVLPYE